MNFVRHNTWQTFKITRKMAEILWQASNWPHDPMQFSRFIYSLRWSIAPTTDCCIAPIIQHAKSFPLLKSINQSNLGKVPLKQSSQRHLLWVGLHKEPSLKARLELFATNTTVLEMRWQRSKSWVPRRGNCVDHNVRSKYVVQSCHHCQHSEPGNKFSYIFLQVSYFNCNKWILRRHVYQLLTAGMKYCTVTSSCRTNRCTMWSLAMSETPQATHTIMVNWSST